MCQFLKNNFKVLFKRDPDNLWWLQELIKIWGLSTEIEYTVLTADGSKSLQATASSSDYCIKK